MSNIFTGTIQLRGKTAAAWATENRVLLAREPGLETDTAKVKYGDGVTAWNSLAYASGGSGSGSSTAVTSYVYLGAVSRAIVSSDLGGPILTAENPSVVALTLPLLATMGVTAPANGSTVPFLRYRVLGAGSLTINPVSGTGAAGARILWNGLDPAGFVPQTGETWTMGPVCRLDYVGKEPVTGNETWVASLG